MVGQKCLRIASVPSPDGNGSTLLVIGLLDRGAVTRCISENKGKRPSKLIGTRFFGWPAATPKGVNDSCQLTTKDEHPYPEHKPDRRKACQHEALRVQKRFRLDLLRLVRHLLPRLAWDLAIRSRLHVAMRLALCAIHAGAFDRPRCDCLRCRIGPDASRWQHIVGISRRQDFFGRL